MWVRGLKHKSIIYAHIDNSVAPYVGAWIETNSCKTIQESLNVAPYVGAWIETSKLERLINKLGSHPMWVRGLKHYGIVKGIFASVAPYVGAWIETHIYVLLITPTKVAPYVGAWIETVLTIMDMPHLGVAPYVGAWIETRRQ